MRRKSIAVASVIASAALLAIPALASTPKTGYYYAPIKAGGTLVGQMFARINDDRKVILLQGTCVRTDVPGNATFGWSAPKHFGVNGSHFEYKGKVEIDDFGTTIKRKADISAKFIKQGKHWKGSAEVKGCKDESFKGDFIGKHPGG